VDRENIRDRRKRIKNGCLQSTCDVLQADLVQNEF
jgi:hypothetical protein